jgi:hypothetical protein
MKHILTILKLLYFFIKQNNKNMKKKIFCICKVTEDFGINPHPNPDPLVRGMELRIQISSGSVQKCHRSGTMQIKIIISIIQNQTLFILTIK